MFGANKRLIYMVKKQKNINLLTSKELHALAVELLEQKQ